MKKKKLCKGVTLQGYKCNSPAIINGLCLHHYSKEHKLHYKKIKDEYGEPHWDCKKCVEEKECSN